MAFTCVVDCQLGLYGPVWYCSNRYSTFTTVATPRFRFPGLFKEDEFVL
jgi:hypothetical protein